MRPTSLSLALLILAAGCAGVAPTYRVDSRSGNVSAPPHEHSSEHVSDSAREAATANRRATASVDPTPD